MAKKKASTAARCMAILDAVSPDVQLETLAQLRERYNLKTKAVATKRAAPRTRGNGTPTLASETKPVSWIPTEPTV